ncbi:MAG TPA: trehalose-phosphatase [Solirubrobacteraceae bacterium]|nr:trehalose-phosphatase [Solirubrobacteraceae bacterium]
MTSALSYEAVAPLRQDPARAAILLDIDGTLAPIVDQPDEASVPEGTRQLLIQISRRYGLVACVSGRRASEARAMVSIGTISYLGSHGAELLRAGWTTPVLDPRLRDWAHKIREFGNRVDTPDLRRLRIRVEDKGAILAFHWRLAGDEEAARVAIDAVAAQAEAEGLRTHWGRKVLEVRPPVQIDKGAGIANLLQDTDVDGAMYVGDDVTDLDAFRILRRLADEGRLTHVLRVGVRSQEGPTEIVSEADIVVEGTDGVQELLSVLLTE